MENLLTIIVPVYNVEEYLSRCVDSILRQDYQNKEIILVDDGSTDKSSSICEDYKKRFDCISVIHKQNGGLSSARNAGLDASQGVYISFIDSDDWIEDSMYSTLIGLLEDNNADIAICRRNRVDEKSIKKLEDYRMYPSKKVFSKEDGLSYLMTFRGYDMSACDKIFRRSIIGDIRFPQGKTCEDSFTTYKFFSKADKITYCDQAFYNYFYRTGSITRNGTVNEAVLEATEEQSNFIKSNFIDLYSDTIASRSYAILAVANEHISKEIKWKGKQAYKKEISNYLGILLHNKNLCFAKKIQFILFAYFSTLYDAIMRIQIRK